MASNRLTVKEQDRLTYEEVERRYRATREPVVTAEMLENIKEDFSSPENAKKVAKAVRRFVKTGKL